MQTSPGGYIGATAFGRFEGPLSLPKTLLPKALKGHHKPGMAGGIPPRQTNVKVTSSSRKEHATVDRRQRPRKSLPLLCLHFHRIHQVHELWQAISDLDRLPVPEILREYSGLGPIQIPAAFNGDDGVGARGHTRQAEAPVKIALVTAKAIVIRVRIFGYQNDHGSGNAFPSSLGEA